MADDLGPLSPLMQQELDAVKAIVRRAYMADDLGPLSPLMQQELDAVKAIVRRAYAAKHGKPRMELIDRERFLREIKAIADVELEIVAGIRALSKGIS